ncbi:MAG TPA: zinc dependent phospholipase C family protein, partial [Candidatus Binatus sp.]|nr:zinc dependent phospholipase C family protein [Candidatus Binatus sp.]
MPVLLVGVVAALVLAWPNDALAWGPVTHLVHGSQVLDSLSTLGPALQEILREHRFAYLYGCVAADIVQAKKYTR